MGYVTDFHGYGRSSHLRPCPTSCEVGHIFLEEEDNEEIVILAFWVDDIFSLYNLTTYTNLNAIAAN